MMQKLFEVNFFGILLLAIWFVFFVGSVLKFGYSVWFRPDKFLEWVTKEKSHTKNWLHWVENEITVLWIFRITTLLGFLAVLTVLLLFGIGLLAVLFR
jgi:hypothetical protein